MKQVVSNYSYSPATNVLTLSGINIDQDQLLLVVAPGVGRTMYNFASGVTGVVSAGVNTRVTLNASTASLTTTSPLVIYYDDQLTNNSVTISSLPAISGTVTANVFGVGSDGNSHAIQTAAIGSVDLDAGYRLAVGLANNIGYEFGTSYQNPILAGGYNSDDGVNFAFAVTTLGHQVVTISNASLSIGNSVTVGSLPVQLSTTTIGGTARLNVTLSSATTIGATAPSYGNLYGGSDGTNLRAILVDSSGRTTVTGSVSILGTPSVTMGAISGTVTASQFFTVVTSQTINYATTVTSTEAFNTTADYDFVIIQNDLTNNANLGTIYLDRYTTPTGTGGSSNYNLFDDTNKVTFTGGGGNNLCASGKNKITLFQTGFPSQYYYRFRTADNTGGISGSAKLYAIKSIYPYSANITAWDIGKIPISGNVFVQNSSVTIGGTVTANVSALPSGALTTRFGSVTTANTSQITTAVTNTSRKYLLAQNISTGTVTIGIGFSPTTTQGIQLTAGAGLTFDSFVPTGAVYWLGATTGAAYTILEG